jgi:hypothetical protein
LLLVLSYTRASAQYEQGNIELTLSGTAGYQRESASGDVSNSQNIGYAMLNLDAGYYIFNGLSLEPQIGFLVIENSYPSQSVLLNISYTKRISNSPFAVYLLGGYGISNSLSPPFLESIPVRVDDKWDVHIINAGFGTKILIKDNVVFRMELNYRRESFEYTVPVGMFIFNGNVMTAAQTVDFVNSYIGLIFGFSIIL